MHSHFSFHLAPRKKTEEIQNAETDAVENNDRRYREPRQTLERTDSNVIYREQINREQTRKEKERDVTENRDRRGRECRNNRCRKQGRMPGSLENNDKRSR
jgi:hypothetical protein